MRSKTVAILTALVLCLSLAAALGVPLASPAQASPMETINLTCTLSSGDWTQRWFDLAPGDEIIQFTRPNLVAGNNAEGILGTGINAMGTISGDLSGSIRANYVQLMAWWDGLPSSSGYFVGKFELDDGHGNTFRGILVVDCDWSDTSDSRWGYVAAWGRGIFSGQVLMGNASYSNGGPIYMTLRRYSGSEVSGPYSTNGTYANTLGNNRVLGIGDELQLVQVTRADMVIPGDAPALYQLGSSLSGSVTGGLAGTMTQTYNKIMMPGTTPPTQGLVIGKFTTSSASGTLSGIAVYDSLGVTGVNATAQGLMFALKENATGVYAGEDYFVTAACTATSETVTINGNLYALTATTTPTWELPDGLDENPMAMNGYLYPADAAQVTLADLTLPEELLVVWHDGGPGVGWKWFRPGWPEGTLATLDPGKYYIGIVSTATVWEIALEGPKEPYKVGAVFAVTGFNSALGTPQQQTVEMLEQQINDAGGINGHLLDVITYDTESDTAKCASLANRLIEQGVVAIIGPTGTGESMAIKPIAGQAQIPLVSCAAGSVIVEPIGNNTFVFNTPQLDYVFIERIYTYLQEQGITKIAIITDTAGFGAAGKKWLENADMLSKYGLTIVADGHQTYEHYDVDMQAQLTKIKNTDAQAVVCWGTNPGPAIVARNMRTLVMNIPLFCSHGIAYREFIDSAGDAANGVIFCAGKLPIADQLPGTDPQKALLEKYKTDFEAAYGTGTANTFGGHAYDALMMVVGALNSVGPDKAKIRDYIENDIVNWPGTGGIFNMSPQDHNGLPRDPKKAMVLIKIVDRHWTWLE
jgi:branched-chain amino acid transport system substrate-binding protein